MNGFRWIGIAALIAGGISSAVGVARAEPAADSTLDAPSNAKRVHWMALRPVGFSLGAHFGAVQVAEATMKSEGISEYGAGLALRAGFSVYDVFALSATTGLLVLSDSREFSTQVVPALDQTADPTSRESTLNVGRHALALGPRTPPLCFDQNGGRCIAMAFFAEYGKMWVNGARVIANCRDCPRSSLNLNNGQFVALGIDVGTRPNDGAAGVLATVTYRQAWPEVAVSRELLLGVDGAF